jgi:hypothetical protein
LKTRRRRHGVAFCVKSKNGEFKYFTFLKAQFQRFFLCKVKVPSFKMKALSSLLSSPSVDPSVSFAKRMARQPRHSDRFILAQP